MGVLGNRVAAFSAPWRSPKVRCFGGQSGFGGLFLCLEKSFGHDANIRSSFGVGSKHPSKHHPSSSRLPPQQVPAFSSAYHVPCPKLDSESAAHRLYYFPDRHFQGASPNNEALGSQPTSKASCSALTGRSLTHDVTHPTLYTTQQLQNPQILVRFDGLYVH
jgi:hypothetical protein